MRPHRAFTLVEGIVLLVIFAVVVALGAAILPSFGGRRGGHSRTMGNNTQIRGIHQAMVMFAQGNKGYFPGLDSEGADKAVAIEDRLQILLENNYFTGEYLVSPSEIKTAWTTGTLTSAQYSYALLQLPAPRNAGHRRDEWAETLNTEAPVLGDRARHTDGELHSVHTVAGDGWRGGVAYNDNHVVFESTNVLATKYGPPHANRDPADPGTINAADDLFTAAGDNDAYFIHSGNQ